MQPHQLARIAMEVGLKVVTVDDLLRSGWTYVVREDQPRVWVGPEAKLKDKENEDRSTAGSA